MNERKPYEDQLTRQWDDLPLPDENQAWEDMKRRLDEEDRKPLLPIWLRGCAGWLALGVLVTGLGWWLLQTINSHDQSQSESTKQIVPAASATNKETGKPQTTAVQTISTDSNTQSPQPVNGASSNKATNSKVPQVAPAAEPVQPATTNTVRRTYNQQPPPLTGEIIRKKQKQEPVQKNYTAKQPTRTKRTVPAVSSGKRSAEKNDPVTNADAATKTSSTSNRKTDSISSAMVVPTNTEVPPATVNDTNRATTTDLTSKIPVVAANTPTADTNRKVGQDSTSQKQKKPKSWEWSGGIGLQQQLPVGGQQWNPFGAQGRKNSLMDYIPSVYLRLARKPNWFIQGEFRYGGPQFTKPTVVSKEVRTDTFNTYRIENTSAVTKTFYHQVPLTFNYVIRRGWSIGAGIQWNSFYRAVVEDQSLYHNNALNTDSVISKFTRVVRNDSGAVFKQSWLQAVVQTQYQWKRFSLGLRYSFGLSPFLNIPSPDASGAPAKLNSLQLYLRFELWKQKKRK